ncbi:MAG: feruloyl-CoA synthase [Dermatophilaceae bacterium]
MSTPAPLFSTPDVRRESRPDGSVLLTSADPLAEHPTSVVHSLREWAAKDPDHILIAERGGEGGWRTVSYGQAVAAATSIGQALLDRGLGPERPLLVLSGNSVDHALVAFGAMTAGIPVAPSSVAYSLLSKDHARIKEIVALLNPGAVFAEDSTEFGAALDAIAAPVVIASRGAREGTVSLDELIATAPGEAVQAAFAAITGDTVAKILFTSGSTGLPKGVINTHRMWAADQQAMRQVWPFLTAERPVIVDWLPWSHTFGGNHNLGMMVTNGGSLYVDAGRPAPGMFERTLANIADVKPTIYFNVPAGFALLVPELEENPEFAAAFFSRLRLIFNAAAALPLTLRERLVAVAEKTTGAPVSVTGSWGLTETSPALTNAHFAFDDARCIGVPLPGVELLLVPEDGERHEIRARGPVVTPGYYGRPELAAESFDAEGFYRTGDAVSFADPDDPGKGLLFQGRLVEDFKLTTATFVHVGAVRTNLLSALPVLADAVIAGEGRAFVTALAWLNPAEAAKHLGRAVDAAEAFIHEPDLAKHIAGALRALHKGAGSSMKVERVLLMSSPADLDAGEITDKGYVNQRKVLANRRYLVDILYSDPLHHAVITADHVGS